LTVCGVFGVIDPLPVTLGVTVCVSIAKLAVTLMFACTFVSVRVAVSTLSLHFTKW